MCGNSMWSENKSKKGNIKGKAEKVNFEKKCFCL